MGCEERAAAWRANAPSGSSRERRLQPEWAPSSGDTARMWELFPTMNQALVDEAKAITPVCLRRQQREPYYLASEPPDWCITGGGLDSEANSEKWQPKWRYHTRKDWLIGKRAGRILPLPSV